ncbi:MAG: multiple sugar transport system ATP-binding protein [Verrucomicrobiota bacterium]|nr:multiple sugar transport system ATP-binding protein [Verrucomicrobiota bacterium]
MAQVVLQQLVKTYPAADRNPAFTAVKGIDLTILDGEFMVLVGPSGCGKSTTLRMIAGLEEVTNGRIVIGDRLVNDLHPKDRDIAMVFQNYALYPHMTVRENMSFGLRLQGLPKAEIEQRVNEASQLLGLESMLDRKPKALSGGQRQRVAVGRAIVRKPKVFLFDEPLSNLDAKMRVVMRTEIAKLHDRIGATMIYVTHDQVEAMTMGDRICVMRDGEIQQVADPLNLYSQPANAYVAGFIGSPPMNLLHGRLQTIEGRVCFIAGQEDGAGLVISLGGKIETIARAHTNREVLFGFRPEDCGVVAGPTTIPLKVIVEHTEPMGAETYLHFSVNTTSLVARQRADHAFVIGQPQTLHLDLSRAHLFARETGVALA